MTHDTKTEGLEDYFNKIDISVRYALLFKIIKKKETYLTNLSIIACNNRYSTGHFLIKTKKHLGSIL